MSASSGTSIEGGTCSGKPANWVGGSLWLLSRLPSARRYLDKVVDLSRGGSLLRIPRRHQRNENWIGHPRQGLIFALVGRVPNSTSVVS